MDARFVPQLGGKAAAAASGAVVYWHVDDLNAAFERLLALGATVLEPIREFGPGFVAAAVTDPFGNVLGVMRNAHYLEMHSRRSS